MIVYSSSVLGELVLGTVPPGGAVYSTGESLSTEVVITGYTVTTYTTPAMVHGYAAIVIDDYTLNALTTPSVVRGSALVSVQGHTTTTSMGQVSVAVPVVHVSVSVGDAVSALYNDAMVHGDALVNIIGSIVHTSLGQVVVHKPFVKVLDNDSGGGVETEFEAQYAKLRKSIGRTITVYPRGGVIRASAGKCIVSVKRKAIKLVENMIVVTNAPERVELKKQPKVLSRAPIKLKTHIGNTNPIELVTNKTKIVKTPITLKNNVKFRTPVTLVTNSKATVKIKKHPIKLTENKDTQTIKIKRIPIEMVSPVISDHGEIELSHK